MRVLVQLACDGLTRKSNPAAMFRQDSESRNPATGRGYRWERWTYYVEFPGGCVEEIDVDIRVGGSRQRTYARADRFVASHIEKFYARGGEVINKAERFGLYL